ncbi:MAG: carboxypeptidase regulatory-like domain-containing protein [Bryobacterales bacterium]|nr:carboxypeptidase regulatory-like domain-containing protein [Bryobacterales bacterium]
MIRILLLVALTLPALFGQCNQELGTPTLPRIQGYLQDSTGKPITGAKLEMVRLKPDGSEAEVVDSRTTDGKGYFRFKRSKDQIYRVRLLIPDRKLEALSIRQGGIGMRTGGGLMNFLFLVDKTPCVSIQLTR